MGRITIILYFIPPVNANVYSLTLDLSCFLVVFDTRAKGTRLLESQNFLGVSSYIFFLVPSKTILTGM